MIINKNFEFNIKSIEDIDDAIYKLKIYRYNLVGKGKNNEKLHEKIFKACQEVYHTIIPTTTIGSPNYYVYAHLNPLQNLKPTKNGYDAFAATLGMGYKPFYIGKGIENRAYELNRNENHRKIRQLLKTESKEIVVKIINSDLFEDEALIIESKLIDIFGLLVNRGILTNLDEGICPFVRRTYYKSAYNKLLKSRGLNLIN